MTHPQRAITNMSCQSRGGVLRTVSGTGPYRQRTLEHVSKNDDRLFGTGTGLFSETNFSNHSIRMICGCYHQSLVATCGATVANPIVEALYSVASSIGTPIPTFVPLIAHVVS